MIKGDRYAIEQSTKSLTNRIDNIKLALPELSDANIMTMVLEEKRLDHLQSISTNSSNNSYFIDPASSFPSFKALMKKVI